MEGKAKGCETLVEDARTKIKAVMTVLSAVPKTDKKGQYCVQFELLSGEKLFFERRFNYLKDKYLSVTADE